MADYAIHDTTLIGTSNIIRKKEGSSALIDPADYPKRINLMGMLEKKTQASASICSFEDGSDDVPTDSVKIFIPANLDGKSSVSEKQTGRNLVDDTNFTRGLPSTTIGASIETISASTRYTYFDIDIKGGIFTVSPVSNDTTYYNLALIWGYTNGVLSYYGNATANTTKTVDLSACDHVRVGVGSSSGAYRVPTNLEGYGSLQFELGSTAHDYEPYNGTTYSANLGQTVHGAEVDIVNGTGKKTYSAKIDMGTLNWRAGSVSGGDGIRFYCNFDDIKRSTAQVNEIVLADGYDSVTANETYQKVKGVASDTGSQRIVLYDGDYSSVADFKQAVSGKYLVYPLDTGTDFTFDGQEIPTMLGYNAFWSDDGDTEVTYRSSGTITPVVPTLISKTITANGTYSAEDDDADGYDEVTVNVPSGTPFKYESVDSSGLSYVFIAMEEGDYLCVLYCSYDGTRTFSTTGTLIFEEDINVAGDSRGIKVALCHLLPNQRISHQATTVSLYNSTLQAIIRLDDSISVSQMVDSYAINDGNTSGYTPSYSGNVLSVAVCGGNNTEHFYDKTIPSDSAIENSVYGGLNSILHIGYGACPNYDMYGYYGNGVYIGLFQ